MRLTRSRAGGKGQHHTLPPHSSHGTPEQYCPICSAPPPFPRGLLPPHHFDGGCRLTLFRATAASAQTPVMTFCSGGGRGGLKSDYSVGKWGSVVTGFRTHYPKVWQLGMLTILRERS